MLYTRSSAWGFFCVCKTISDFVPKGTHRPLGTASRHLLSRVRHLLALDCENPHSSTVSQTPSQLTQFGIRLPTQLSFLRLFFFSSKPQGFLACLLVLFALYLHPASKSKHCGNRYLFFQILICAKMFIGSCGPIFLGHIKEWISGKLEKKAHLE